MSAFTEFSAFVQSDAGRFVITKPLRWEIGREGSGLAVTVPAGFRFDVSVPSWLHWLVSPTDRRYLLAACVHDWLLKDRWKRNRAAIEFYHGLRAARVNRAAAVVMTAAVLAWTTA